MSRAVLSKSTKDTNNSGAGDHAPDDSSFVAQLRQRGVFRVCSIYMVAAWGASMGAAELFPAFGVPEYGFRWFVIIAALGVPLSACLAWAFDFTSAGIVRDYGPGTRAQQSAGIASRSMDVDTEMAATQIMTVGTHPLVEIHWKDERGQCRKQLSENFSMGRGVECEISFDDPMVSRKHALVTFEAGHWWIEDQKSANGTWVDGKRVQKAELPNRSEVRLSDTSPLMIIEIQSLSATTMVLET